jgi:WD40 repeat protein
MAFRNDNKIIVLITGPYARIYDIKDGKELLEISHNDRIFTAVFSVNNNLIATGSQDGTVRIFDISANREIKRLTPQKNIYSLSFSPDGKNIAATHQNNSALVYKLTYDNIEEYACWNIGRNLTLEEWQKYIGDDIYKELCSINLIK